MFHFRKHIFGLLLGSRFLWALTLGFLFWNQASGFSENIPFKEIRRYQFSYEVNIQVPKGAKGGNLSLWVPYPVEDESQKVLKFKARTLWDYRLKTETKYGNRFIYFNVNPPLEPVKLTFEYEILRVPYRGGEVKKKESFVNPLHYLGPDLLVPFYPLIRDIAKQEGGAFKTPSQKIKAFYEYVVETMTYDKSGVTDPRTGWGRGDAVWACTSKRGNCTDFHSLFMGMNRSQNIPARFEMGVSIPQDKKSGEIPGYHCWAQAYADDLKKWIPIDATEAKKSGRLGDYFGVLPSNRIHFTTGRDIMLNPLQKGEPLNFFIYPYAEIGGEVLEGMRQRFSFKRI